MDRQGTWGERTLRAPWLWAWGCIMNPLHVGISSQKVIGLPLSGVVWAPENQFGSYSRSQPREARRRGTGQHGERTVGGGGEWRILRPEKSRKESI